MLIERAQRLLMAWDLELISSDQVVGWADARILECENPGSLPDWLLCLAQYGPAKCAHLPLAEFDFPWPEGTFETTFAAAVVRTDWTDRNSVEAFVREVSQAAIGEDTQDPRVMLGYRLDHEWCDCDRMDRAVDLARREILELQPEAQAWVDRLVGEVARAQSKAPG